MLLARQPGRATLFGPDSLRDDPRIYARPWDEVRSWARSDPQRVSLAEVVRGVRPTILIGLSTVAGALRRGPRSGNGRGSGTTHHFPAFESYDQE